MKGRFVVGSNVPVVESNIYADKSALVLDWLLQVGIDKHDGFSLRDAASSSGVSVGLVQRICSVLVFNGILRTEGVRTAKKFFLKQPYTLLKSWLTQYNIAQKCKMRTYRSGFSGRAELLAALKKSPLHRKVVLALHSAADAHKCKNTNLDTLELYVMDLSIRQKLETLLQLEPQERGYEVLLIEPYYESLINTTKNERSETDVQVCSPLLTFLDLYHFPLRGREQAEFMAERISELKRLYTQVTSKFGRRMT